MSVLRFEKGEQGRGVIQKQPVLNKGVFSLSGTITWFEGLMAALDCYNWVLNEQLLAPSEVFQGMTIAVCCGIMFTCAWGPSYHFSLCLFNIILAS